MCLSPNLESEVKGRGEGDGEAEEVKKNRKLMMLETHSLLTSDIKTVPT